MSPEKFDSDAYWRKEYLKLCYELGEIINEQQDKILALSHRNKCLERENWNLKRNRKRK